MGDKVVSTTTIGKILGIPVSVKFLNELGFKEKHRFNTGVYWDSDEVTKMAFAISQHLFKISLLKKKG